MTPYDEKNEFINEAAKIIRDKFTDSMTNKTDDALVERKMSLIHFLHVMYLMGRDGDLKQAQKCQDEAVAWLEKPVP